MNLVVGVFKRGELKHMPPSAKRVPYLMEDLFAFLERDTDTPYLIKACIFHYELEFIHPFEDGNGRMGRLWQQLLLMKDDPIFEYLCVETLIKKTSKIIMMCWASVIRRGNLQSSSSFLYLKFMHPSLSSTKKLFRASKTPLLVCHLRMLN